MNVPALTLIMTKSTPAFARIPPLGWLLISFAITAAIYWPGLVGPLMLDDFANLMPVQRWYTGEQSLADVVFGNRSGVLGRSLSMASFVASAALGAPTAFHYKLGNLALHLACGWLAYLLIRRLAERDPALASRATTASILLASVWLMHPLHVSTVLYAVQRMAQVSALCVLASLLIYVWARLRIQRDARDQRALLALFVVFPIVWLLGLLGKENAAVASMLCLVIEAAYFSDAGRPRAIKAFFAIFVAIPVAITLWILAFRPGLLLEGYNAYDFSLWQRVLTQPRALLDYAGQILLPRGPLMGLFTDDFMPSTGLLTPATTLPALLAMAGISALAVILRKRIPGFFAGWFFFLVAHMVESGFLPLDLYFEHRNYLPSLGLLLAAASLLAAAIQRHSAVNANLRPVAIVAGLLLAVLCFATFARVQVWRDTGSIVSQGLQHHPRSLRANLDAATLALRTGRQDVHDAILSQLVASEDGRHRLAGRILMLSNQCLRRAAPDTDALELAVRDASDKVLLTEANVFKILSDSAQQGSCGLIGDRQIAASIDQILQRAASQPDEAQPKWLMRYQAAQLYGRNGDWQNARAQAELAWTRRTDAGVGAFLAEAQARTGDFASAERTLREVSRRIRCTDQTGQKGLAHLWARIQQAAVMSETTSMGPLPIPTCRIGGLGGA